MKPALLNTARRALPLMTPEARAEAEALIVKMSRTGNRRTRPTPDTIKKDAAAAFEADMQPVCNAIVNALHAGDMAALKGLRALLPHLLEEVNQAPALADLLALQLGKSLLDGMKAKPEEAL